MFYRGRLLVIVLPFLANCESQTPHAGQPTPQAQSMQRMRADVDTIHAFAQGSSAQSDAESAANDLVAWSGRIGELFPPSEAPHQYVDMTPEMAAGAPAALRGASEPLLAAVKTGDRQATGEQLARTEHDGCGYCHLTPYPR
jgi:hypothetical protein